MADAAHTARAMWTLFEPIHAVIYFVPEGRAAFEEAGLRGFWRGYFAGRAAPLGPAGAAVVTASFFNFAPAFVARAIPAVWDLITPEDALRTRLAGADAALRGLLAGREAEATVAADLLWQAIGELDFSGRVLAAANAALPVPDGPVGSPDGPVGSPDGPVGSPDGSSGSPDGSSGSPGSSGSRGGESSALARLWQAATVLREHRGDGHFAALAAADIDGCEAVALRCCMDLRRRETSNRCGAGPTSNGTAPSPDWPTAAGSAPTASSPTRARRRTTRWKTRPTGPRPARGPGSAPMRSRNSPACSPRWRRPARRPSPTPALSASPPPAPRARRAPRG